jgi:hypothetical protein
MKKHFDPDGVKADESKADLVGGRGPASKRHDSDDLDGAEDAWAGLGVKLDVQGQADGQRVVAVYAQAPEADIERRGVGGERLDPYEATRNPRLGSPMLSALQSLWSLPPPRAF